MGIFGKLKQFGERMEAASQQMMNSQLTVTINNQEVKIGEELSGTITLTSQTPCSIKSFNIVLLRELDTLHQAGRQPDHLEQTGQSNKDQWVFNKEAIQTPLQLQAGETKTVPFKFIVKDGTEYQPLDKNVFGKITPFGLNPSVLPPTDVDGSYVHKLNASAQVEGAPMGMGPVGGVDNITFVYPSLNLGVTLGGDH